jgi:hypothetical protein
VRAQLGPAVLAAAVVLFIIWNETVSGASATPWKKYWGLVDETERVIALAEQTPAAADAMLRGLPEQWETVKLVEMPDGRTLAVNTGLLIDQLRNPSPDLEGIRKLLDRIKASRPRESAAAFTAADVSLVQDILARPEYDWSVNGGVNRIQQFVDDLLQKIIDFLNRFSAEDGTVTITYDPRAFITLGVFLVLLAVLYFSFRGVFRELVPEANLADEVHGEEGLTAARAMQRAQDFSAAGDHRQAVRYLYLSALFLLDERGLLRYDRSRTNREYLSTIHEHPQLVQILRDVIDVFDRVWYGYRSIDNDTYAHYLEQVNRLKEQK